MSVEECNDSKSLQDLEMAYPMDSRLFKALNEYNAEQEGGLQKLEGLLEKVWEELNKEPPRTRSPWMPPNRT